MILPKKCFLTKGVGVHREKLSSFELALRDAGIAPFNIVRVSSIFPPQCKIIPKPIALKYLSMGQIIYAVMSECATNEPNRLISAAIGVAIPKNPKNYGYLSEHHAFGQTEKAASDYAEDLAASMLATILGVKFNPDDSYDARKEQWEISNEIVRSSSIAQSARGPKNGDWVSVIACSVLIG